MKNILMRQWLIIGAFVGMYITGAAQSYEFDLSPQFPFGLPHPEAPTEILDFAPLIGESQCKSVSRNPDQSWGEPIDMTWRFKYIMNGWGVQDETLKSDGKHSGSIRQFIPDSGQWYVHYYSSAAPSTTLPAWEGSLNEDGAIILYREQQAPNGMDGFYKINFYDINDSGFKWLGEWVTPDESFSFPTWKIECQKDQLGTDNAEKEKILTLVRSFSQAYMDGDYEAMANAYTTDGKIFPNGGDIIEGKSAIMERWTIRNGSKILLHQVQPIEIKIMGDVAYDHGYYNGKTKSANGEISEWQGKYVIVWHKEDGQWKMYLDIWNNR